MQVAPIQRYFITHIKTVFFRNIPTKGLDDRPPSSRFLHHYHFPCVNSVIILITHASFPAPTERNFGKCALFLQAFVGRCLSIFTMMVWP